MLILSTPGMLNGGMALDIFKEWCEDSRNKVIIPGYCVQGTYGHEILSGAKKINIQGKEYSINCKINKISFSAHADDQGIKNFISQVIP